MRRSKLYKKQLEVLGDLQVRHSVEEAIGMLKALPGAFRLRRQRRAAAADLREIQAAFCTVYFYASTTSIPMLRAVPSMMRIAASSLRALISSFLI